MIQPYAPLLQQMLLEFQNQRHESAERIARSILRLNSKDLIALQVQGLCMAIQGRMRDAVDPLSVAASLDSKNIEVLTNLAKAQHGAELFSEAIKTFERLNHLNPNNPRILVDLGTSYAKLRKYQEAEECYKKALRLDSNYFLGWSNLGNLQAEKGYPIEAIKSYEQALQLNSSYAETWTNYGNAFFDLNNFEDACRAHDQALLLDNNYAEAWFNKANALSELKQNEAALTHYEKAFNLKPQIPLLIGQYLNALAIQCDWGQHDALTQAALDSVSLNKVAVPPFIMLQTPASIELQSNAARSFINHRISYINLSPLQRRDGMIGKKIRIGYFSTDFKEHPVGILMENLIKLHDRSQFEIYGYFLNKKCQDPLEMRFLNLFDKSVDLFGIHDSVAQKFITEDALDIAIDLNGHTAGARTSLFARRIAPIQVNYLGYAGTTGGSFYDYIIADKIVAPLEDQPYYSEKIAHLPHSFFPADSQINHAEFGPIQSRLSQGLPAEGFIFACFNNAYKISPIIFNVWMKLLKKTENSVLWLSSVSETAKNNLINAVQKSGVDPNRIIFANRESARVDHLSRLRLADLFLDTPNFNAHSTASDALWAGVPVLTLQGRTFAGRVAASQLTALQMTELIAHSVEGYEFKALEFATHPEKIKATRQKLENNRSIAPLFDTRQYIKDLESLYSSFIRKSS